MIELKDLNIDKVIEHVEDRHMLVINPEPFVEVGLFSEDFPPCPENCSEFTKNKWQQKRDKKMKEGVILDLQTLNVMKTVYEASKHENKYEKVNKVLSDPFRLLKFIDLCWSSIKVHN